MNIINHDWSVEKAGGFFPELLENTATDVLLPNFCSSLNGIMSTSRLVSVYPKKLPEVFLYFLCFIKKTSRAYWCRTIELLLPGIQFGKTDPLGNISRFLSFIVHSKTLTQCIRIMRPLKVWYEVLSDLSTSPIYVQHHARESTWPNCRREISFSNLINRFLSVVCGGSPSPCWLFYLLKSVN